MANYQPVIDQKTQQATGYYFNNGTYYKYDPSYGYVSVGNTFPTSNPSQPPAQPTQSHPDSQNQTSAPTTPAPAQGSTSRSAESEAQKLVDQIFGKTPQDYKGTFETAYGDLSQPIKGNENIAIAGTQTLADAFVDKYLQKAGKLPSEEVVRKFVAQNLTTGFASKIIMGGISKDQIIANIVDPFLDDNPEVLGNVAATGGAAANPESRILSLSDQLDKLYESGKKNYVDRYNTDVYSPAKTATVNDLAGQGMLTQPNSRYSLDKIEANRGRDLSSGLNTLEGNRAAGNVDLSTAIEGLLQKNADRSQNAYQFNKSLGLQNRAFAAGRDDTAFNQGLKRRDLDIASQLGRLQAKGQEDDWMDYLNTGLKAAGAAASVATAFCWVSRFLFGDGEKTNTIRNFLLNHIDDDSWIGAFARAYSRYGERWAEAIESNPSLRDKFELVYNAFYVMGLKEQAL